MADRAPEIEVSKSADAAPFSDDDVDDEYTEDELKTLMAQFSSGGNPQLVRDLLVAAERV
jgi:hypothetical protein